MKREMINEAVLEGVVGGSIVFTTDKTTCGYNRNDQYRVVDFDKAIGYIMDNIKTMDERDILANCAARGYIEEI